MRSSAPIRRSMLLVVMSIVVGIADLAGAVDWDGGGQTSEWNDRFNWVGDQVPSIVETGTIINDAATITGMFASPVGNLEVGLGATPGQLLMTGSPSNTATLEVNNIATISKVGQLSVGASSADLFANEVHNFGDVFILADGEITAFQAYSQGSGSTNLDRGELTAPAIQIDGGMLGGSGTIAGDVTAGGLPIGGGTPTLAPGLGVGTLNIDGDLDLRIRSELVIEIDASGRVIVADLVNVSGTASLGGTLRLELIAGNFPAGEKVDVVVADTFEPGEYFDDIIGTEIDGGSLIVAFDPGGFGLSPHLRVYPSLERGDMNGDAIVDELDANLFASALRDQTTYLSEFKLNPTADIACNFVNQNECGAAEPFMADIDFDETMTFIDVQLFLDKVAQSGGSPTVALQEIIRVFGPAVPEPSTLGLALVTACLLVSRTRSRAFVT